MPAFDANSFALGLFERHARPVRRYLYRLTRNPAVADDLAQEVFLRVVRSAAGYEAREREAAWVFRIAGNVLRDFQRRVSRPVEHVAAAVGTAPNQVLELDLDLALARLPPDECEALLLGEVVGLTYPEIAEATGVTVPAVRSRIYRARQALRAHLIPPAPALALPLRGHHDD
jgi:RNA polymerase sigma-70 factor (ECF subfamily)